VSSSRLDALTADLAAGAFAGACRAAAGQRQVGVEVEFIPVETATGRRCAIDTEEITSMLPFLRRYGAGAGWIEGTTSKGTPCFSTPAGGALTFEPGGQLEYSSPPCPSAGALLSHLRSVVFPLCSAAAGEGIDLLSTGIDPFNSIEQAPLLTRAKRYVSMAEYFETVGPAGALMMRQTAALQVNLDFGEEPWLAWRVINALVPFVTGMFANSAIYDRRPTGYRSTRAAVWRAVDPARTGIVFDGRNPVEAYRDFALAAPALLLPRVEGRHRPFAEWLGSGDLSAHDWHEHLSTLFPEVRPRGHLELRSADAVPPDCLAAPLALLVGILYQPQALKAADDLLGSPDPALLDVAAQWGVQDPRLQRTARDLIEIALAGCAELPGYFDPADLEQARAFFDQYTNRGRALADDALEDAVAA
jgi:glutamate--cysteine ligase